MLLIFTSEPRAGEVVDIDAEQLTIGRVAENDLQLADEKVSRHHAVIELRDAGHALLRDLGSSNGTFVNGRRLSRPYVLTGGEHLRLGDQQLRFEAGTQTPAAAAPAPVPPDGTPAAPPKSRAARFARVRDALSAIRSWRAIAALAILLALVLVFGVGQLVLPGLAEQHLRSQLERYGPVRVAEVTSAPAVKLLWHRADSVKVVMDSYHSEPGGHGSLADFLSRTRDTGSLDVQVGTLRSQLVTLHEVSLHKEGDALIGRARLTKSDLSAALPSFVGLQPVSASANGIVVQVTVSGFGHRAGMRLDVQADGGRVVVRPQGLLGTFAAITVFSDPRVFVESLGAELRGNDYLLSARARLR